jgi:FkbM family methyltransferase
MNVKQALRTPLRRLGYDLRRIDDQPELIDFLQSRNVDVLLDVGANEGQFARLMRDKGYRGDIISFEPVSGPFEKLKAAAAGDPRWFVQNLALGMHDDAVPINVAPAHEFSSFRQLAPAGAAFDPKAVPNRMETVQVRRLDTVWQGVWNKRRVFLKVDTQGSEREIMLGTQQTLHMLLGVQLELPIVRLYEGVWSFDEALAFMARAGLVPAQIHVGNYHLEDPASLIEVDCVFRPMSWPIDGSNQP